MSKGGRMLSTPLWTKEQIREWMWSKSEIKRDGVVNGLKCVFLWMIWISCQTGDTSVTFFYEKSNVATWCAIVTF